MDKGLGRLIAPDIRDQNYPIRGTVKKASKVKTFKYHNANGWWGDQGNYPYCVGFGMAHFIEDAPVTHAGGPYIHPVTIYHEAQKIDEWAGEGYDGTSVRAGLKYLQSLGLIESYRWGFSLSDLVDAVFTSPVPVGTSWYSDMSNPTSEGLAKVSGYYEGGHCYLVNGVNTKTKMFRCKNSWGRGWGDGGMFQISFEDMEKLILDYGEIAFCIERKQDKK